MVKKNGITLQTILIYKYKTLDIKFYSKTKIQFKSISYKNHPLV